MLVDRCRALNPDRSAYRVGPAKLQNRKDNRAEHRTKSHRKSKPKRAQIAEKTTKFRPKIDEKSLWGSLGRPRSIRERPGRRPERLRSAKKSPRGRSWEPAGSSRIAREASGEHPGGSWDAVVTISGAVRTRPWHHALSKRLSDQFFFVFVSSHETSRVLRVPRFTMFCCS